MKQCTLVVTDSGDQDKFVIDANDGALSFKTVDVDNNNAAIDLPAYTFTIRATDAADNSNI